MRPLALTTLVTFALAARSAAADETPAPDDRSPDAVRWARHRLQLAELDARAVISASASG